jgi:hypothetical protein
MNDDGGDGDGDDPARLVRPYVLTGGRTEPAGPDLRLETMVRATGKPPPSGAPPSAEARTILALCREPASLVEIAARARLPIGVTRVLVADLAADGLIDTTPSPSDQHDVAFLQKVLDGIREL